MALKLFKSLFGGSVEVKIGDDNFQIGQAPAWEEVVNIPVVKRTKRIGMDKNFRVGKVKRVSDDRARILVDTIEMCNGDDGEYYLSTYNLWIDFNPQWRGLVTKNLTGKYVVVGFYIQSFRNKDVHDKYDTILSCRFLNELADEREAKHLSIELAESRLFIEHPQLKLSNINK